MSQSKRTTFRILEVATALGVIVILIILLLPDTGSREAGPRAQCANNLKQIGLALQNYYDAHTRFPPVATLGKNGEKLHSWRVLILPFLEQQTLYEAFSLDEKWNGPRNKELHSQKPYFFECSESNQKSVSTSYLAITGIESPWIANQSTDNVVPMVIESALPGPIWCEPVDVDVEVLLSQLRSGRFPENHRFKGAHVLFSDGSVDFMSSDQLINLLERLR